MRDYAVAARSRTTIGLADAAGPGAFGAVFQSTTAGLRHLTSRDRSTGAPTSKAARRRRPSSSLSGGWYFAEGSRGGELFDNFFLLFNPHPTPIRCDVPVRPRRRRQRGQGLRDSGAAAADAQRQCHPGARGPGLQHDRRDERADDRRARDVLAADRQRQAGVDWRDGECRSDAVRRRAGCSPRAPPRLASTRSTCCLNPNAFPITVRGSVHARGRHAGRTRITTCSPPSAAHGVPEPGARQRRRRVGDVHERRRLLHRRTIDLLGRRPRRGLERHGHNTTLPTNGISPKAPRAPSSTPFCCWATSTFQPSTVWITLYVEGFGPLHGVTAAADRAGAWSRMTIHMNTFLAQVEASEGLPPGTLQGKSFAFKVTVVAGEPDLRRRGHLLAARRLATTGAAAAPRSASRDS